MVSGREKIRDHVRGGYAARLRTERRVKHGGVGARE